MERVLIDGLLVTIVLIAAFTDAWRGKVYNALTFPAMALGLALNGIFWGGSGLEESLRAGAMAFAILIIPVAVGAVGAGDLKLLVAVGVLGGAKFLLLAFLFSGLILGAVSAIVLGYRRVAFYMAPAYMEWGPGRVRVLPYAVAIAMGCLIALYWR